MDYQACRLVNRNFPSNNNLEVHLVSVKINSVIQNSLCTLTLTQEFLNQGPHPIECEYEFPKPEDFVISSLTISLPDGSILNSNIENLDIASEIYQDEISQGNTPILSKMNNHEKMTLFIGNLSPNEKIKIQFTLISPLESEDCHWKLRIPFCYFVSNELCEFDFSVTIISESYISSFSSNYSLNWSTNDNLLVIGRMKNRCQINDEIWVKFRVESSNLPSCLIQKKGNKYAAMMSFIPFPNERTDFEDLEVPGEFIFVLDRSGSMVNQKIILAKQAAILFIKSLPQNSLFNIISFGSTFTKLFEKSQRNNTDLTSVIEAIKDFKADMGGTEIFEPLDHIFKTPSLRRLPRTVFLLTDGEVRHPEKVVNLIRSQLGTSRVHTFGIGEDADFSLIKDCAKAGRGFAFFVSNEKDIGKKVITALRKSILPCLNNWTLNWKGESFPKDNSIGNIFYGERCIQYILLDGVPNYNLNIKCFDTLKNSVIDLQIQRFREIEGEEIFKLWAKNKIDHLSQDLDTNKNLIIEISKEFQIPSIATALVCVKENSEAAFGDMEKIKIPVSVKKSTWEKYKRDIQLGASFQNSFGGPSLQIFSEIENIYNEINSIIMSQGSTLKKIRNTNIMESKNVKNKKKEEKSQLNREIECETKASKNIKQNKIVPNSIDVEMKRKMTQGKIEHDQGVYIECSDGLKEKKSILNEPQETGKGMVYLNLITLQTSDGSWKFKEVLSNIPIIKNVPARLITGCENDFDVITTVFVLGYLNKYYESEYEEWILLEKKALRWLKTKHINFEDYKEIIVSYC